VAALLAGSGVEEHVATLGQDDTDLPAFDLCCGAGDFDMIGRRYRMVREVSLEPLRNLGRLVAIIDLPRKKRRHNGKELVRELAFDPNADDRFRCGGCGTRRGGRRLCCGRGRQRCFGRLRGARRA